MECKPASKGSYCVHKTTLHILIMLKYLSKYYLGFIMLITLMVNKTGTIAQLL